jgi:flagellar biosynthesis/type III secretory pathway protein FliH
MKDLIKKILKEDNDFDWAKDIEPISKSEIANMLEVFDNFGYRVFNEETNTLVNSIYNLGLNNKQLSDLIDSMYGFSERIYDSGINSGAEEAWSDGNRDGYNEGYRDAERKCEDDAESEYNRGYGEGYDEGYVEGESEGEASGYKKGYEEGVEITYYKAFEEGRAYEAGVEVEDLERRESGFDPLEYDEDYDENY